MGGFITHLNMPGWMRRNPSDHGHGPLAMVVESILHPGRLIAMHEHQNDEIISWVPAGVMRHTDEISGKLVTDPDHLLVENAGRSFWHSEETLPTDPPLRMLQILARPRELDLEANVQHGPIAPAPPNTWRHLFGPEGGGAPFFVRNALDFFDIRVEQGAHVDFPAAQGGISTSTSSPALSRQAGRRLMKRSRACCWVAARWRSKPPCPRWSWRSSSTPRRRSCVRERSATTRISRPRR